MNKSIKDLKYYKMIETDYIVSKLNTMENHLNNINNLVKKNYLANALNDIEYFTQVYTGVFEYILKEFENIDIKNLDGSNETEGKIYNLNNMIYMIIDDIIDIINSIAGTKHNDIKLNNIKKIKSNLKMLKSYFNEYFKNIDML